MDGLDTGDTDHPVRDHILHRAQVPVPPKGLALQQENDTKVPGARSDIYPPSDTDERCKEPRWMALEDNGVVLRDTGGFCDTDRNGDIPSQGYSAGERLKERRWRGKWEREKIFTLTYGLLFEEGRR